MSPCFFLWSPGYLFPGTKLCLHSPSSGLNVIPRAAAQYLAVTALITLAMINLLIGVILRYGWRRITNYMDWDSVTFTWVEEVGEMALALADADRGRDRHTQPVAFRPTFIRAFCRFAALWRSGPSIS